MFQYRVKYTESESHIKNSNSFYKNTKNVKILSKIWKSKTSKHFKFLFCNRYKLYNYYFVFFGIFENFVILGFWDFNINLLMLIEPKINGHICTYFYIYIYIYINLLIYCSPMMPSPIMPSLAEGCTLARELPHAATAAAQERHEHVLPDTNMVPNTNMLPNMSNVPNTIIYIYIYTYIYIYLFIHVFTYIYIY